MASKTPEEPADEATEKSLELPSLGFGRKRKQRKRDAARAEADTAVQPVPEPHPAPEPVPEPQPVPAPDPVPEPTPVPEPQPEPATVRREDDAPTRIQEPVTAGASRGGAPPAERPAPPATGRSYDGEADHDDRDRDDDEGGAAGPRTRRRPSLPALPGLPTLPMGRLGGLGAQAAAALTGAVVGFALVGGTVLTLSGCDVVRGTRTCGGGAGFGLLLALLALAVLLGTVILRAATVPDAGAVSFLGVGVLALFGVVFLAETLLSPWMILVVPVITTLGFVLGQWISTLATDPDD